MLFDDDENFVSTTEKIERKDKFKIPKEVMKKRGKNYNSNSRFDSVSVDDNEYDD